MSPAQSGATSRSASSLASQPPPIPSSPSPRCALGLSLLSSSLSAMAVLTFQPIHSIFYLIARMGAAIGDTATATLVARTSRGSEVRAHPHCHARTLALALALALARAHAHACTSRRPSQHHHHNNTSSEKKTLAHAHRHYFCHTCAHTRPVQVRARNLGLIQSTRAGARVVTPILSAWLFERSRRSLFAPGALPYLLVGLLLAGLVPVPLVLRSFEQRSGAGEAAVGEPRPS